jgi:hypothetical protein
VIDTASGALGVNDHSIMNYNTTTIPYKAENTLLEPTDWKDALCNLGGVDSNGVGVTPAYANCTQSTAVGTSTGVAAGNGFYQISGVITGTGAARVTNAKANVPGDFETGVACNELPSVTPPLCATHDSSVHLQLCTGPCSTPTNVKKDVGLAVLPDEGHGDNAVAPDGFDAMVAMDTAWTDAALIVDHRSVFTASASDPAPTITGTSDGEPGTILGHFSFPGGGNGRALAFDGQYLYATRSGDTNIYKFTTTGASAGGPFDLQTQFGALAYSGTPGVLYAGSYDGSGVVYRINLNDNTKSSMFAFNSAGESCLFGGNFIDGLEYRPTATNLAVGGDGCTRVHIVNLDGTNGTSFATDDKSGITTDGAGGLWIALLTRGDTEFTELAHVDVSGNQIGNRIILPNYEAEDLAFDSTTFAGKCAIWMNQATFDTAPEIQAVQVPCNGGSTDTPAQQALVQTANTTFVSLFFTCGDPTNLSDDSPTFPLANGLTPDTSGQVVAAYSNKLFCGEGTPQIISEASNGWKSTGVSGQNASAPVNASSQVPVVNIAAPLNGAKFRRGEVVHYAGSATDAEQEAITGSGLQWFDGTTGIGSGQSFDLKLDPTAALGPHTIKLEATDAQGHKSSATVTISVGPALCASTANCP